MRVLQRAKKWSMLWALLLVLASSGPACAWRGGYYPSGRYYPPHHGYYYPRGIISNRNIPVRRPMPRYCPRYYSPYSPYGPGWNRHWKGGGGYLGPPGGGLFIIIK